MNYFYLFLVLSGSTLLTYFFAKSRINSWKAKNKFLAYPRSENVKKSESAIYTNIFVFFILCVLTVYYNTRISPIKNLLLNNFHTEVEGIVFNTQSAEDAEGTDYFSYEYEFFLGEIKYNKKIEGFGASDLPDEIDKSENYTVTIQFIKAIPFISRIKSSFEQSTLNALGQIALFIIAPLFILRYLIKSSLESWKDIFKDK